MQRIEQRAGVAGPPVGYPTPARHSLIGGSTREGLTWQGDGKLQLMESRDSRRDYFAARLVEINEQLADLDDLPNPAKHRAKRERLVAEGVELLATLATFSNDAHSLN